FRRQGRRDRRALSVAAGERHRDLCRRKALDPGAGAGTGLSEVSQWPRAQRAEPRLQAARHLDSVRRARSGDLITAHKRRRRRLEFLDFMNEIAAAYPDTAIHAVLDNLNTHKPKNDRW